MIGAEISAVPASTNPGFRKCDSSQEGMWGDTRDSKSKTRMNDAGGTVIASRISRKHPLRLAPMIHGLRMGITWFRTRTRRASEAFAVTRNSLRLGLVLGRESSGVARRVLTNLNTGRLPRGGD